MTAAPLLGVIIPTHNEEDCIADLVGRLNRVVADLEVATEIVCVDDDGTDTTVIRPIEYAAKDGPPTAEEFRSGDPSLHGFRSCLDPGLSSIGDG